MKMIKNRSKGVIKKKRMSRSIILSVLFMAIIGVFSILYLCYGLNDITYRYTQMLEQENKTTDTLKSLEDQLYRHQFFVFEHVISTSPDLRENLEKQTSQLKSSMYSSLNGLKKEMKDTKYDIRYKSLSANIRGYLYDADSIFEWSHTGEYDKVNEFMEDSLVDYINTVNSDVQSFSNLFREDVITARKELEQRTRLIYSSAIFLLILLFICSIVSIIVSCVISNELVNIDPLTVIPNYDYFTDHCQKKKIRRVITDYSVICINIKGFQYFNQQFGTSFGDSVLTEYAAYLKNAASKKHEIVARINGDSFAALIKKDRVPVLVDYLNQVTLLIHQKDGARKAVVKSRCGIYDIEPETDIAGAISFAQTALKQAKSSSSADCIWYTNDMTEKEKNAKEVLAKFSDAIKRHEFVVYYQPKVNMTNNRLCGSEALVRWIKDGKMIPPFRFIPVLEEEGYITELDFYVFEQVCKDISKWVSEGIEPVRVSSNFSKLHLKNKRFAEDILDIIEKYHVDKKYIEIELTESSGYDDFEAMTVFVNRMKTEKIYTAIDDFGTGYSSLSLLKDLDIDVVKLDKSFLNGAEDDAHKKMIENVVKMINDLHRKVICEGVETEQQAGFLKSVECFLAQGYLYDKPLPHDEYQQRLVSPVYSMNK